MAIHVDTLLEALESGASPVAAVQSLIDDGDAELLRRASVVRRLDEHVMYVVGEGPADLERLVELGVTEAVPGTRETFRLHEAVRDYHYPRWWPNKTTSDPPPPELVELSKQLDEHYKEMGDSLEAFYHRALHDPNGAIERFQELYKRADERFDLAQCRDLLDVFHERLSKRDAASAVLANDYRSYLGARGLWIDDWYRSARFLEPAQSEEAIEELLTGDGRRILHVWAQGGLGKTMHLHWLIARRSVPQPERIACARVDFDMVDSTAAVERPWLVLLELASQLDIQLRDKPFLELLKQYGAHRARLSKTGAFDASSALIALPETPEEDGAIARAVRDAVLGALGALAPSERVLLVLDTLEVPLFVALDAGDRPLLENLVSELAEVAHRVPSVRLVLSGRYDLRERLPGFETIAPDARTLHLTGFREDEARRYLRERRGVTNEPLVRAAARAGGPVPFKLALIADVIQQRDDLKPADIEQYREHDLLYLIKRVLERVDEPAVRWVLRYGVVPRVLDFAFLRDVMLPRVEAGMAGRSKDVEPSRDALPARRAGDAPLWPTDSALAGRLDVDELWARLKLYAGRASWVSVDQGEVETLRFHPDLVNPMRRLLAEKEIFRELHRDARKYFAERAKRDPNRRDRWLRESIFHRFQGDGPKAAKYWRNLLSDFSAQEHAELRRQLAQEVLGNDYVDHGRPRAWFGGKPLVSPETLVEARFERAWATAQLAQAAGLAPTASQWLNVEESLRVVSRQQRGARRTIVPRGRMALARASLLLGQGKVDDAGPQVELALRGRIPVDDRVRLAIQHADALARLRRPAAEERYHVALRLAKRSSCPDNWAPVVLSRLCRLYEQRDDLAKASGLLEDALEVAGPAAEADLLVLKARLRRRLGHAVEAAEMTAELATGPDLPGALLLHIRSLLSSWQPRQALESLEGAEAMLTLAPDLTPPKRMAALAQAAELRGVACGQLLDVDGALRAYVEAVELWSETDSRQGICLSYLRRAAFLLRGLGDLRETGVALRYAKKVGPQRGSEAWVRLRLLKAERSDRMGEADKARDRVDQVIATLQGDSAPPRSLVAAAATGLALHDGSGQERYLSLLCEQLELVDPPQSRLTLLRKLRRCPPLTNVSPALCSRLRRLAPSPSEVDGFKPQDLAVLAIADADLDRVIGDREGARSKLRRVGELPVIEEEVVLRERLDALVRAGGQPDLLQEVGRHLDDSPTARDHPLLASALILLAAMATAEAPPDLGTDALLRRAAAALQGERGGAGRWQAILQEVLARRARQRGDEREARQNALLAADVYERLYDSVSRERVLAETEATAKGPPKPPSGTPDDALLVTIAVADGELDATMTVAGERYAHRRAPLKRISADAIDADSSVYPFDSHVMDMVARDWGRFGRVLALLLLGDPSLRSAIETDRPRDVRLRVNDLGLQPLPWELARFEGGPERLLALHPSTRHLYRTSPHDRLDSEDVRALQYALAREESGDLVADGVFGPATHSALRAFQQSAGLPATGVPDPVAEQLLHARLSNRLAIVVQAAGGHDARSTRSVRQSRTPLELVYMQYGFETHVVDGADLDEVLDALRMGDPAIVHIGASFVEDQGSVALDLTGEWETIGSLEPIPQQGRLTPAAIGDALRRRIPKPLIVLDPPAPRSPLDVARQLLLRNAFAGDLFALGCARALLAVGLTAYGDSERLYDAVVGPLARAFSLGEVVDGVRATAASVSADTTDLRALPFAAAALFARSADIRPPWPSDGLNGPGQPV